MFGFFRRGGDEHDRFELEAMPFLDDVYRVALWLSRDISVAQDLTQETFFQALKSFHSYEKGTNCKAWLMTILHHANAKRLKKQSRLRIVEDPEEIFASTLVFVPPVPESITDEDILRALASLPEQFRSVVVMADVEDFAYKEVSAILGVPIGTVMSRLHRGRKLLRAHLASHSIVEGFSSRKISKEG